MPRMAFLPYHSPATNRRALTHQPRYVTEWMSQLSASQQQSSNNAAYSICVDSDLALNARQRTRREKASRPWCVCSSCCVDECRGGLANHAPNQPLRQSAIYPPSNLSHAHCHFVWIAQATMAVWLTQRRIPIQEIPRLYRCTD